MKTKYLDTEIERLNLLERNDELTDWGKEMLSELKEIKQALRQPLVSVSLLERAASLVGNPGTNISGSTDMACDEWQKDYERWRNER